MAAHLRNANNTVTSVRVYDSARLGSREAYLQAQLDGAEFIVGPLGRTEVDQVIEQAGFVPTLALGYATNDTALLRGFYQFALAPEDEARAVAAAAIAAGAKTAVAFVPSNQGGYRIRDSFRAAFEAAGGTLLDSYGYEPALQDFSAPTAALLNVTRSRQRHQRLAANLGVPVQFPEARRRQDVDMIFVVVADSRHGAPDRVAAALLRRRRYPCLRERRDLRSRQHGPRQRFERLHLRRHTGARFAGSATPTHCARICKPTGRRARAWRVSTAWGSTRTGSSRRLYANDGTAWSMRGLSGDLSLDEQGRVRRVLPLAQFQSGRPVALDMLSLQPIDSGGLIGER